MIHQWDQKAHSEEYLTFAKNIGECIITDEVSLSKGELYTFATVFNNSCAIDRHPPISSLKLSHSMNLEANSSVKSPMGKTNWTMLGGYIVRGCSYFFAL